MAAWQRARRKEKEMNKSMIEKELRQEVNGAGFINRQKIKRRMGCGNGTVDEYTRGLPFIRHNRNKMYSVKDVAERIAEYIDM